MFRVRAVNTASDSENKIHDDAVAAGYGFRGGLVPGVTVYGYMASAVIAHFGTEWIGRGAMDVRFHEPVYEGDEVEVALHPESDGRVRVDLGKCASGIAWIADHAAPDPIPERALERREASTDTLAPGTIFGSLVERLDLQQSRLSAPLDASIGGLAHPAVTIALANRIFVANYELGPWIHVSSEVRKFRALHDGAEVRVCGRVLERFERKGHEFVVFEVLVSSDGPAEHIRHTAIWRPRVNR